MPKVKVTISDLNYRAMSKAQQEDLDAHLRWNAPVSASIEKLVEERQRAADETIARQEHLADANAKALERRIARDWLRANPAELLGILRNESTENDDDE